MSSTDIEIDFDQRSSVPRQSKSAPTQSAGSWWDKNVGTARISRKIKREFMHFNRALGRDSGISRRSRGTSVYVPTPAFYRFCVLAYTALTCLLVASILFSVVILKRDVDMRRHREQLHSDPSAQSSPSDSLSYDEVPDYNFTEGCIIIVVIYPKYNDTMTTEERLSQRITNRTCAAQEACLQVDTLRSAYPVDRAVVLALLLKPEVCDDGIDNDCDGILDTDDENCIYAEMDNKTAT
jgi:hypothetical protein